tara:strand:+ start:216 stop:590 length:375 start_codon:yes stop_codon:yes gene_type:complete
MPRSQTANTGVYGFGAPVTESDVLTFRVRKGGRLTLRVENYGDTALGYTVQVSPDNSSWADTASATNGDAVADESCPARQYREHQINLRDGQDNFVRLQASGGVRGELQIRGDNILEIDRLSPK